MAALRKEIYLRVLKNIFQHEKINFVSPSDHVIYFLLYKIRRFSEDFRPLSEDFQNWTECHTNVSEHFRRIPDVFRRLTKSFKSSFIKSS